MTATGTLYLAPGSRAPAENVVECVMQYIDEYWQRRNEIIGWDHLGLPVPLMDDVIEISVVTQDDPSQVMENLTASVEDVAQTEIRGEVISVFRESQHGPGALTIIEDEADGAHVTSAKFDALMGDQAFQCFGHSVTATVVDMGGGYQLTEIEVVRNPTEEPLIRGYLRNKDEPWLTVRVLIPQRKLGSHISFIIATGSQHTTLMPHDAERLGLNLTDADLKYRPVERRPGQYIDAAPVPATIAFLPERGDPISQEITLMAAHPREQQDAVPQPSVLGTDSLANMRLEISPRNGVTLTRSAAAPP